MLRTEVLRVIGNYDAAKGFTATGGHARETLLATLDALIAAEDDA